MNNLVTVSGDVTFAGVFIVPPQFIVSDARDCFSFLNAMNVVHRMAVFIDKSHMTYMLFCACRSWVVNLAGQPFAVQTAVGMLRTFLFFGTARRFQWLLAGHNSIARMLAAHRRSERRGLVDMRDRDETKLLLTAPVVNGVSRNQDRFA